MRKLSISEMRRTCKDHFFADQSAFRGSRNFARYDKKTKTNYIKVIHQSGRFSWYRFNANGKTSYVPQRNVPFTVKGSKREIIKR